MSGNAIKADWSLVGSNDPSLDVASCDPDVQFALCHPSENKDAAAYFIINFCRTMDEDMGGAVRTIDPKPITLYVIRTLDFRDFRTLDPVPPANIHIKKSRRMLVTWLMCAYVLWKLQYSSNFSALLISKDEPSVDDGGLASTTDSMFGRLRFMHDHLPHHIRRPVSFAFMRARSGMDDGYIVGRAPTIKAGRGSGVQRVVSDENAHQENAEVIHVAVDPMCKMGKVYASSTNGPMNLFAQIEKKKLAGWRFIDVGWEHDPEKAAGIRRTVTDRERERFGEFVSPWLETATRSLIDDGDVAAEYGRKYNKSRKGLILREFSRERHVRKPGRVRFDPTLELIVGLDFGHARKTVAMFMQPVGMRMARFIGAYFGEHRNAHDNAIGLRDALRAVGFNRPLDECYLAPDPSAMNEEIGSGMELISWYRAIGFTTIRPVLITGPDSVSRGNNVFRVLLARDMVEFADECGDDVFEAYESYRLPVDRVTGDVRSNVPVHDMASHPCDATRYAITCHWTADDVEIDWSEHMERATAPRGEGALLDRAGRTMREIRGGDDAGVPRHREQYNDDDDSDSDDDDDAPFNAGVGARTMTSTLHRARF